MVVVPASSDYAGDVVNYHVAGARVEGDYVVIVYGAAVGEKSNVRYAADILYGSGERGMPE